MKNFINFIVKYLVFVFLVVFTFISSSCCEFATSVALTHKISSIRVISEIDTGEAGIIQINEIDITKVAEDVFLKGGIRVLNNKTYETEKYPGTLKVIIKWIKINEEKHCCNYTINYELSQFDSIVQENNPYIIYSSVSGSAGLKDIKENILGSIRNWVKDSIKKSQIFIKYEKKVDASI